MDPDRSQQTGNVSNVCKAVQMIVLHLFNPPTQLFDQQLSCNINPSLKTCQCELKWRNQHLTSRITDLQMAFRDKCTRKVSCIFTNYKFIHTNHSTFIQMRTYKCQIRSSVFEGGKAHLYIVEFLWIMVHAFTNHSETLFSP